MKDYLPNCHCILIEALLALLCVHCDIFRGALEADTSTPLALQHDIILIDFSGLGFFLDIVPLGSANSVTRAAGTHLWSLGFSCRGTKDGCYPNSGTSLD